ncbi:MAG: hypothetical protein RIS25_45 [Actinomycetota bacterium]
MTSRALTVSVTAIVVSRRSGERLGEVLESLRTQSVAPDAIVVADASGGQIDIPVGYRTVSVTGGLGDAVATVLTDDASSLVWILRDDTVPARTALANLRAVIDASPSVGAVGPKQMDADRPAFIREFGESMSRTGVAVHLAEHELDQAQYDRVSDVLAVGEAGMLVRREAWDAVGGFDSALDATDAALDFGIRVRGHGYRIEVVPSAVITVSHESTEAFLGDVSAARIAREESRALAYRRLVHGGKIVLPFHALWLLFSAVMLLSARLVRKKTHAVASFAGTLSGIFATAAILRAQSRLARSGTRVSYARLLVSPAEMRRRRALERDAELARSESGAAQSYLPFGAAFWWFAALATVGGIVLSGPWLGAPALVGGGMRPMPTDFAGLWSEVGATAHSIAAGFTGAPDGFTAVLAGIGAVTWWNPNSAIVAVMVLAVPLSFVTGWLGAGAVVTRPAVALLIAGGWAVIPGLHLALSEGRISAVIAHIALPIVFRTAMGRTAVSAGWLAISAAVVWSSAPVLAPIVILLVVYRALAKPASPAVLLALAPGLALEWPRILETFGSDSPLTYFADRGVPVHSATQSVLNLLGLTAQPAHIPFIPDATAQSIAWGIAAALAVVTLVGLALTASARLFIALAAAAIAVTVAAQTLGWTLTRIGETSVGIYSGTLLDVVWWALLVGTAAAIARAPKFRASMGAVIVVAICALAAAPATAVLRSETSVTPSAARTLPAYIDAETSDNRAGGTLIITPLDDGYRAEIQRGSGVTLLDWPASATTRQSAGPNEQRLAELAANLVVDSGFDEAAAFADLGIDFVVLIASPHHNAVSSINSHSALVSVGATDAGVLWAVDGESVAVAADPHRTPGYLLGLAVTVAMALVAGIPTTLRRRRHTDDDEVLTATEAGDDDAQ